jgi:nucleoside-diphosphate-sugar epimerase
MAKLVVGCGYLGLRIAMHWIGENTVYAVTRSSVRAKELQNLGFTALVADVTQPHTLRELPVAQTVLYAVGYDRSAGLTMREVYVAGLSNVLGALPPQTERIIYISSTGVYGQCDGERVDETSACIPTREGGRACLEAERVLQSHELGRNAVILRMGGLYGPGRIPRREDLAAGRPIAAAEHGYLNLIHVEDAANVVLAAEARAPTPATYNVSDGHPVLRGDYFRELARLAGVPAPRFGQLAESDPRAQRAASDKRVSNRKMLAELQVTLKHPTNREGLAAILAQE